MGERNTERGTLGVNEQHPSFASAAGYVLKKINDPALLEALASTAIESNRMSEVCLGTIQRIKNKQPVSDRYILGLAWFMKELEELGSI